MKKERLTEENIISNEIRRKILKSCLFPKSISNLEKELNINRGTLKHHIKILERVTLIERKYLDNVKGKPAQIKTNKNKLSKLLKKFKHLHAEYYYSEKKLKDMDEDYKKSFGKSKIRLKVLRLLNEEKLIGDKELEKSLENEGVDLDGVDGDSLVSILGDSPRGEFIKTYHQITPKGQKFLREKMNKFVDICKGKLREDS